MLRYRRFTQWLPYAVIRWWIRRSEPGRGTLHVDDGPKPRGSFWEIHFNEVIFIGDRGAYERKKEMLEEMIAYIDDELARQDEREAGR